METNTTHTQVERVSYKPETWTAQEVEDYMNRIGLKPRERAYYNRVLRAARAREEGK